MFNFKSRGIFSSKDHIPAEVKPFLDPTERGQELLALSNQGWAIASTRGLMVVKDDSVVVTEPWCSYQHAIYQSDTDQITLTHIDPQLPPIELHCPESEVIPFMEMVRSGIEQALITSRSLTLPSGTEVRASVLRGDNGEMFSTLVTYGQVLPEDEAALHSLEAEVRDSVGLPS